MFEFKDLQFTIHIGMPKTASTFLQEEVFPNLNLIYLNEYYYFKELKWNQIVYESIRNIVEKQNYLLQDEQVKQFQEEMVQIANERQCNKFIFSSEELVGFYAQNFNNSLNVLENIRQYFGKNIKIILVIREQVSFLESLYRQSIKMGHWINIETFLNYQNGNFYAHKFEYKLNLDVENFDWFKMIEYYTKELKKNNLLFLPYEMLKNEKKEFIDSIVEFLNIEKVNIEKNRVVNKSYTYFALFMMRFFNRFLNNGRNPIFFIIQTPLNIVLRYYKNETSPSKTLLFWRKINSYLYLSYMMRIFNIIVFKKDFINDSMKKELKQKFAKSNERLGTISKIDLTKYGYHEK